MVKIRGKQSRDGYLWCPSWRGKTRWGTHLREIQSSHLKWVTFDGFQCRPGRNVKQTVDWCGKFHGEASVTGNTCKSTAVRWLLEAKTNKGNNVDREESHSYALVMQKRKSLGKRGCGHSERGGDCKKMSQGSRKNASDLSQVPQDQLSSIFSKRLPEEHGVTSFLHSPVEDRSSVSLPEKGFCNMDQ